MLLRVKVGLSDNMRHWPKSPIFTGGLHSEVNMMLAGCKSRWIIRFSCRRDKPESKSSIICICLNIFNSESILVSESRSQAVKILTAELHLNTSPSQVFHFFGFVLLSGLMQLYSDKGWKSPSAGLGLGLGLNIYFAKISSLWQYFCVPKVVWLSVVRVGFELSVWSSVE